MTNRSVVAVAVLVASVSIAAQRAVDVTGRWTSSFTTDVGDQQYTFEFVVKGTALTGTAKSNLLGENELTEGKVEGDRISFVENASFMEMPLRIVYTGVIASADEIQFTRVVAEFVTEKLVATRGK